MSKKLSLSTPFELLLLLIITIAVHAVVLFFIFPKYYNPLWPHHSDFYIPSAIVHSSLGLWDYIHYPRPTGIAFFYTIGQLGTRGTIAVIILITALNCVITASLFRRAARIPFRWPFLVSFILYLYLLFSAPGFYIFYTQDAFAQLSYFLLAMGCWGFYQYSKARLYSAFLIFTGFCLLAFLSKETYILSIGFIAACWFLFKWKEALVKATLPFIGICIALGIAFLVNYINKSPFTNGAGSSYQINFSLLSIIAEWYRYASEGLNWLTLAALGLTLYFVWNQARKLAILGIVCVGAGALAWLPNALLPEHHFIGYSWNGAYLLFLPIICLVSVYPNEKFNKYTCVAIVIMVTLTPLLHKKIYKRNQWVLLQEDIQRNLLTSIAAESSKLSGKELKSKILVTGIDFPFSPFNQPSSLKEFKNLIDVKFDVLVYKGTKSDFHTASSNNLKTIDLKDVNLSLYDRIWGISPEGRIIFNVDMKDGKPLNFDSPPELPEGAAFLYPKLYQIFGHGASDDGDGDAVSRYLKCGQALISYQDMTDAIICLSKAAKLAPENPYPYFYMGKAQESLGLSGAALGSYRMAIHLDKANVPNPWFVAAMSNLQTSLQEKDNK